MGFFGKLFEKKECSVCGGEIGLLGNRKLEDGNCCKNCARKLSPWFEDRRHSTVAQIHEQLAYRERNQAQLADFRVSQVIGEYYKMYIEEIGGVPTRFFVTSSDDYMEANPDIIAFKDLLSCVTDVRTYEKELKREDANGNRVSYNPPRFETDYDFYVKMQIGNNPYFDDIKFQLNSGTVTLETRAGATTSFLGMNFTSAPVMAGGFGNMRQQERYQEYTAMCQQIEYVVQRSRMMPPSAPPAQACAAPSTPQPPAQSVPQAAAGPKFCPNCGTAVSGGKFCPNCGTRFEA